MHVPAGTNANDEQYQKINKFARSVSKLIDTRGTRVHTAARWKRTTPRKLSKSHSVAAERKGAARSVSTKLREVEFCLFALEEAAAAAAGTKGRKEAVLRLAVVGDGGGVSPWSERGEK